MGAIHQIDILRRVGNARSIVTYCKDRSTKRDRHTLADDLGLDSASAFNDKMGMKTLAIDPLARDLKDDDLGD